MDIIKFKRGRKQNLPTLNEGEPAFITDEKELYIGSTDGNVKLTRNSEVETLKSTSHTHSNKSVLDTITDALVSSWNSTVHHISDAVKHITSSERTLWNTVVNKVDKVEGKGLSTNDFTTEYKNKVDNMNTNATKVEKSSTNGNIKINSIETVVYTHPTGTNPHGTTKSDIGLSNVTNDAQVKRSEMGANSGVATLDSNGINAQAPKAHTHDDRYYTEAEADARFATKGELGSAGYGDMLKSVYDTNGDGVVDKAASVPWDGITGKPSTYTPATHIHDDRYYTEAEVDTKFAKKSDLTSLGYGDMLKSVYDTNGDGIVDKAASVDWSGITSKPSTYTPSSHTHDDRYYTETEADSRFAPASHTHNYKKGGPLTWDDLKS